MSYNIDTMILDINKLSNKLLTTLTSLGPEAVKISFELKKYYSGMGYDKNFIKQEINKINHMIRSDIPTVKEVFEKYYIPIGNDVNKIIEEYIKRNPVLLEIFPFKMDINKTPDVIYVTGINYVVPDPFNWANISNQLIEYAENIITSLDNVVLNKIFIRFNKIGNNILLMPTMLLEDISVKGILSEYVYIVVNGVISVIVSKIKDLNVNKFNEFMEYFNSHIGVLSVIITDHSVEIVKKLGNKYASMLTILGIVNNLIISYLYLILSPVVAAKSIELSVKIPPILFNIITNSLDNYYSILVDIEKQYKQVMMSLKDAFKSINI